MKESKRRSKLRAYKNHMDNKRKRFELKQIKQRNYRNLNAIVLTGESKLHSYAKSVVSIVLSTSGEDFITELSLKNSEVDVYAPSLGLLIELQRDGKKQSEIDKILKKYNYLLESNFINDVIIFDLFDFSMDFNKDYEIVKYKLGV